VRWRGAAFALLGAAAVAGIAFGFSIGGGGGDSTVRALSSGDESPTTHVSRSTHATSTRPGTTEVEGTIARPRSSTARHVGTVVHDAQSLPYGHRLLVGTVDDSVKQGDPALAADFAKISADAGFGAILVSSTWTQGLTTPTGEERVALSNAVAAARKARLEAFVFVWHGLSGGTPRTVKARQQFARYAAAVARAFPGLAGIVVGNEPNLNTFWMPQFGPGGGDAAARAYFELLARSYDAIKAVAPRLQVIGGALAPRGSDRPQLKRDTHSPTQFISDLGAAYRASGRTRPVMDAFAIHPYMRASAFPPTDTHAESTTITIADYPKLASLLTHAFAGTGQRGRGLPVYYTEFGVQTTVPAKHRPAYTDLASPSARDAVAAATQAEYYRQALLMAVCQRTVRGLFVFHTFDERDLGGWQSGLYYADQQPKPSLDPFRRAAALAAAARLAHCAGGTFVRTG
jgi:hypothetical protein